jgi:hypothetical protein
MSNKSRGRHRFDVEPEPEPDPDEEQRIARLEDALETPGRKGLEKLVGMVMDARNKPEPKPAEPAERTELQLPARDALREPTAYESAILYGLRDKPVYQGTVEPWRVADRRRRNRSARRTRQQQRRRARR